MIDCKSVDQVCLMLQQDGVRNDFIASIYSILHNTSNSNLISMVLHTFARLGGHSRAELRGCIDLPAVSHVSCFLIEYSNHPWDIQRYFELAVKFLDRNLILESLDSLNTKLSVTLRCSKESIAKIRAIRVQFKRLALQLVEQGLRLCLSLFENMIPVDLSLVAYLRKTSSKSKEMHENEQIDPSMSAGSLHEPSIRVFCADDIANAFSNLSDQDRAVSLLFLGLFIACCDVEVKAEAQQILSHYLAYFASLFVSYSTSSSLPSTPSLASQASRSMVMGPSTPCLPLGLAVPLFTLNPLLILHTLVLFLQRDQPIVSSVVIHALDVLFDHIRRYQSDSMLLEVFLAECLLQIATRYELEGQWRLKMNLLPVYVHLAEVLPDFAIARNSCVFMRFISRTLAIVPTEMAVQTQERCCRLINLILLKAFHIQLADE